MATLLGTVYDSTTSNVTSYNTSYNTSNLTTDGPSHGRFPPTHGEIVSEKIWIYCAPILLIVAIVGNTISFLVMRRPGFRNSATGVFLQCLAIADTIFVVIGILPEWLEMARIVHLKELHQAICKIYKFSFYVSGDVAIYILVAFTVHRCYSVCCPLQERASSTMSKIRWIVLGIVLVSVLKSCPQFWARGEEYKMINGILVKKKNCGYPSKQALWYNYFVRPYVVLVVVNVLPLLIITVCNILIIKSLMSRRRFSRRFSQRDRNKRDEQARRQTTIMGLTVSFAFLILMTPSLIIYIGRPYWEKVDGYKIAKAVNNLLVYVNHSCNFLLYCLSARRFRTELCALFGCNQETKTTSIGGPSSSDDQQELSKKNDI